MWRASVVVAVAYINVGSILSIFAQFFHALPFRPRVQSLPRKISRFLVLLDQLLKQHLTELAQLGPRLP